MLHCLDSLGLASAHQLVFQIFDPQIRASMQISPDSIYPIQRPSLTYHFSETIHFPFTPSLTNYILANTDQLSLIPLSDYFQTKVSC